MSVAHTYIVGETTFVFNRDMSTLFCKWNNDAIGRYMYGHTAPTATRQTYLLPVLKEHSHIRQK